MKRFSVLLALGLFLALSTGICTHGSCAISFAIRHVSSIGRAVSTDTNADGFDVNTATNPLNAYFWQYGAGDTVNGGTCTGTQNQARLQGTSPSRFVFYNAGSNWQYACTNGCPGYPPTGTRTAVVIWQNVGEGTTGHKLLWAAYSVMYNTALSRFDFSTITNGTEVNNGVVPNNVVPQIPTQYCPPECMYPDMHQTSDGLWEVQLTWSAPGGGGTNGNMGYYDTAPSGLPLIQDYEVYYQVKPTNEPPTSGALAGWTMYPTRAPASATSLLLQNIPAQSKDYIYLAMRPRFYLTDGSSFAPPYVGAQLGMQFPSCGGIIIWDGWGTHRCTGANATMCASVVDGGYNRTFQWTENGSDIAGATNYLYTVQKNGSGVFTYGCKVYNDFYGYCNGDLGDYLAITWLDPPAVDITPDGTTIAAVGSSMAFTAFATGGTPPYYYYWKRDGTTISGAINSTLSETYSSAQSHTYNCSVYTPFGGDCVALDPTSPTGTWQEAAAIEIQNQHWTDVEAMAWDAVGGATGYRLQRGQIGDLPNLLNASEDSCRLYEGADTSVSTLDEDPSLLPAGDFYWYIVLSLAGATEGSAGNATAGPRILNSSGDCP